MTNLNFEHNTNWGAGNKKTFVPVGADGEILPHVYGHLVNAQSKFHFGEMYLPNWENFDAYLVKEGEFSSIGLMGSQTWCIPTGFELLINPMATAEYYFSTYCDAGCWGCDYEYEHLEWRTTPMSGVFLCEKGAKVVELRKCEAGESFFPEHFQLMTRSLKSQD